MFGKLAGRLLLGFALLLAFGCAHKPQNPVYQKPKYATERIKPAYPEELRRKNVVGDVVVVAKINAEGTVDEVVVAVPSEYPEFNEAAKAAAMKQRYIPATKDGKPIGYRLKYTYRFRLNSPNSSSAH